MAKDFQLIHMTVDPARLKNASSRRRNQFVGCMHAHNELTVLNRLLIFSLNDTADGELHDYAQSVQMWCLLQLLTAKLVETWIMLRERFLRSNPPDLVSQLEAGHQISLEWLANYFGRETKLKDSPLRLIRDKTAFHYDRLDLTEAVENLDSGESNLFLAEHPANSLYHMGSVIVFHSIFAKIADAVDGRPVGSPVERTSKGVSIALKDVQEANNHMHALLYGLIRLLIDDVLGPSDPSEPQVRININDAPKPTEVGIRTFIDVGS